MTTNICLCVVIGHFYQYKGPSQCFQILLNEGTSMSVKSICAATHFANHSKPLPMWYVSPVVLVALKRGSLQLLWYREIGTSQRGRGLENRVDGGQYRLWVCTPGKPQSIHQSVCLSTVATCLEPSQRKKCHHLVSSTPGSLKIYRWGVGGLGSVRHIHTAESWCVVSGSSWYSQIFTCGETSLDI